MSNTPAIDIYYAHVCGLCTEALNFLRSRNLNFSAHAVEWDSEAQRFVDSQTVRAMYARCGEEVDFVPQIFIGEAHIKGWRCLEPMIASGEFDRLLAGGS